MSFIVLEREGQGVDKITGKTVDAAPSGRRKWSATIAGVLNKIWSNTDPISKWLQVVALCVAGYWTFKTFDLGEAPSLKPTASVAGELHWESIGKTENCFMSFHVSIKNIGKTALDVDRVHVRAWHSNFPSPNPSSPSFFDVDALQESAPQIDQAFSSGNLVQHYLPQVSSGETFTWAIGPQEPGIYLFRADAENKGKILDFGRQWLDGICANSVRK